MLDSISEFLSSLGFAIVATVGINMGTPEPRYSVLERIGERIEIRAYPPRLVAETPMSGPDGKQSAAFSILAGYIFGANHAQRKFSMTTPVEIGTRIGMTAPVAIEGRQGAQTMRFFLPADLTLADLPEPDDSRVSLRELPAATVATLRFSGLSDHRDAAEIQALTAALAGGPWKIAGPASSYYYNPPWTLPPLRHNEVVIPVTR